MRIWLGVALTAAACAPPYEASLSISGNVRNVDPRGGIATLKLVATDEYGSPGTGAVRVTSTAGSLTTPETATLVEGKAELSYLCDVSNEPACGQKVRIVAEWLRSKGSVGAELSADVGSSFVGMMQPTCIKTGAAATLRVAADDAYKVWFNGTLLGEFTSWMNTPVYDVQLRPGAPNVIAIEGNNLWEIDGIDRGVIAELAISDWGKVSSGPSWKLTGTLAAGWSDIAFDDSSWPLAIAVATNGAQPWGTIPVSASARWLWSYVPRDPASAKPMTETVYVRHTVNLPALCP